MPAKSIKQQRFMGMVRRAQKTGQASSPEVAEVAASMKKKDVKDYASTKHKGLPMKKEEFIREEDSDRLKDRRMERGGVGGNQRYDRAPKPNNTKKFGTGKTAMQKEMEKKYGKGASALDIVKAEIRKKHGKGAIKEEQLDEAPYQVYGSPDGKKEKKIGKPVKSKKYAAARAAELSDTHKKTGGKYRSEYTEETINERGDFWHPDPEKDRKLGGPGANQRAREDRVAASKPKSDPKKLRPGESYMEYAKRQKSSKMKRESVIPSFKSFLQEHYHG